MTIFYKTKMINIDWESTINEINLKQNHPLPNVLARARQLIFNSLNSDGISQNDKNSMHYAYHNENNLMIFDGLRWTFHVAFQKPSYVNFFFFFWIWWFEFLQCKSVVAVFSTKKSKNQNDGKLFEYVLLRWSHRHFKRIFSSLSHKHHIYTCHIMQYTARNALSKLQIYI